MVKKPHLFQSDNKNHPAIISDKILELSNKYNFNEIAVLCRTKNQVKIISKYLSFEYIPTRTYLQKYFEIQEIRDLLAWCHVVSKTQEQDRGLFRLISMYIDENFC